MAKPSIPVEIASKVLFFSDRTCCVCRVPKKPLQIHHIDGNNANHDDGNLAVLCLDCHTDTQIKGGFGRKLDAAQVKLYRDEWLEKVGRYKYEPKELRILNAGSAPVVVDSGASDIAKASERIEAGLRKLESGARLMNLVLLYDRTGKSDLRDKCIDKLLLRKDVPIGEEIFFRSMQGKVHLVDKSRAEEQLNEWKKNRNWSMAARAYRHLGRRDEAIECYCLECIDALKGGNPFTAGYYIKEMMEEGLGKYLFECALQEAKGKNDIWWQIRSLQELGRDAEIDDLVLQNRELIERTGRGLEVDYLNSALKRKEGSAKR